MTRMDWVERTLAGDPNAFEQIFEQYKNLVYKTAFLMLENSSEAEDALQEIFLKAYRSLGTYNPSKGALSTWLYRITVNHCLNQRRKLRHAFKLTRPSSESEPSIGPSLEEQLSDDQALQSALNRLSIKLRTVIILRFFLDLTYSEIAQVLDVPLGTVKSRLNLALNKVRDELRLEGAQSSPLKEVSK
jgi:RNA polymerase sigma-70 factor (ECF subfamily)